MLGVLFLLTASLTGIWAIRYLLPFSTPTERLFWGGTLGTCASTGVLYIISRAMGDLNFGSIIVLIVLMAAPALTIARDAARAFRPSKTKLWLTENWPLLALSAVLLPILVYFFREGMFRSANGEMILTLTSWYDMALHVGLANSFVYGQNFPPVYGVLPDEPLRYPFMSDFYAAILLKLGWSIRETFSITSILGAANLIGCFYCFARRITRSTWATLIAGLLFFFNGGLGFIVFVKDWLAGDSSLITAFTSQKENYTDHWGAGLKWANIITSGVIPQRPLLYGMSITLLVLTLVSIVWTRWNRDDDCAQPKSSNQILLFSGVITGLLPLWHIHSYLTVGLVTGILFLIQPRREWLVFWLPALLMAIPQLLTFDSSNQMSLFFQYHFGWMSYTSDNLVLFVIMNFGLPLVLIIPALIWSDRSSRTFYIPFAFVLVLCFFVRISPNDFDNLKLMYYWHAATAVVLGAWLARASGRLRAVGAALLIFFSIASGILAVRREANLVHPIFNADEIEAGTFTRDVGPADALYLTGQYPNQPAFSLGGKRIFLGYDFWITSHGYPRQLFDQLKAEVVEMYKGGPQAEERLHGFGIRYVYIGPHEIRDLGANKGYFDAHHDVVFRNRTISIYRVGVTTSGSTSR